MELPENAPVRRRQSIEVYASVHLVWSLMSEIEQWPKWNTDIKSARLLGNLRPGTTFKWKAGPGTITSTIEAVEPEKMIGWSGKLPGILAVHIWRIEGNNKKVVVTTEESWSGIVPKLFRKYSEQTLEKAINDGLLLLKHAAENQYHSHS
ncbi:MAG: SRPBCC family protein [Candidatus Nomurabacteria bacterium]|nr:MAG: SRPBCC family protein [Candidatus Nomurabacteria bacterium]